MKKKSKFVLTLGDTHIGSTVGLWPDDMVNHEGAAVPQSFFQRWLWDCWGVMQDWVKDSVGKHDLTTVFMGDLQEGTHHRTTQIMTPEPDDQFAAAMKIMTGFMEKVRPNRLFMIKGTECHTGSTELGAGKLLGAVKDPTTGQHAWDYLKLEVNGVVSSYAHHCSATTRKYLQASQHSIMIADEAMRAVTADRVPARVVNRAHRHEHGIWDTGDVMSCITGPWQGLTRFGHKVVVGAVCQPSVILARYDPGCRLPKVDYLKFTPETKEEIVKI